MLLIKLNVSTINKRYYSSQHLYNIPERYRNAFYLANASFFDDVNWYLHKSYEACFDNLVKKLSQLDPKLTENKAAAKVDTVIKAFDQCNAIIDVRFPIRRENGNLELIRGFRSNHGLLTGHSTCLGGLRIDENITRDQIKALAVLSSYKFACMGISISGAAGGLRINPSNYSEKELNAIVNQYATELYKRGFCGRNDLFEPDINSGSREMGWISESFSKNIGKTSPTTPAAMGKPPNLGGLQNYNDSASQAAYFALDCFMENQEIMDKLEINPGIKKKCFIIQGLGKVGSLLAQYLENAGASCVGIKEHDCMIYDNKNGVNIKKLLEYKEENRSILGFPGTKPIQDDSIYTEQCDILIYAAHQKSLRCFRAKEVQAKVILEAANGPIPPIASKTLLSRNKLIIPDVYACAGASVVSYLEYLINMKDDNIDTLSSSKQLYENVLKMLTTNSSARCLVSSNTISKIHDTSMNSDLLTYCIESIMVETGNEIMAAVKRYGLGLDIRTAAYTVAVDNIYKSIFNKKMY